MTETTCDTCQHWDAVLIRHRGKPESLCRCHDSADYRRYVNTYHTCHWHSGLLVAAPRHLPVNLETQP